MTAVLRNALLLMIGYYVLLLMAAVLRFGQVPDHFEVHPWFENVRMIINGIPDPERALTLILREPWLVVGRSVPDLPMREWSIQVLPPNLALVLLTTLLLGLHLRRPRPCRRPAATALAGAGSAGTALAAGSLTWIACCSSPSWVVLLAMLGVWIPTALELEYLGPFIAAIGMALLGIGAVMGRRPLAGP